MKSTNGQVFDEPLRFGLFHGPHHATNLDPTYAFQRDLMLMEHLDRLGFDEAWIGEHHSGGFEISPRPRSSSPPRPSARSGFGSGPA